MGTKSSHSPRTARRSSARKRAGANRSNRSRPKPPAAPPAAPPAHDAGASVARAEPSLDNLTVKREVEVRRIPLARPFHACPRCDNNHETLEVKRLTRPSEGFSHFAMCPNLGEPILVAMGGA